MQPFNPFKSVLSHNQSISSYTHVNFVGGFRTAIHFECVKNAHYMAWLHLDLKFNLFVNVFHRCIFNPLAMFVKELFLTQNKSKKLIIFYFCRLLRSTYVLVQIMRFICRSIYKPFLKINMAFRLYTNMCKYGKREIRPQQTVKNGQ